MADVAPGQQEINEMLGAGFTPQETDDWKSKQYGEMTDNGFHPDEVKKYFGDDKPPDMAAYKAFVKRNLDTYQEANKPTEGQEQKPAGSYLEAFKAGWGLGDVSLFAHPPDYVMPEHADWAMKALANVGQFAGDAPMVALGMLGGAGAGAGAGLAVGGPAALVTGAVGAGAGAMFGAGFVPETMRQMLLQQYKNGEVTNASDFTSRLAAATWEGIKSGGVMLATAGVGRFVGPLAEGAVSPYASKAVAATTGGLAQVGSEIGTMASVSAALHGHMPSKDDFTDAALMIGGIHSIATVMPKLMSIYEKTGQMPTEVANVAKEDVQVKQNLMMEPQEGQIGVPSAEEQAKLGLKPVGPDGKVVEEPPKETAKGEAEKPEPLSDDENKILSRIGKEPDEQTQTLNERWKEFRTNHLDKFEPLKDAGANETYIKARIFNAVNDRIWSVLNDGTRDAKTGDINGEAINSILKENADKNNDPNQQRLMAYWMARQGLDLDAKGVESLFPTKEHFEAAKRVVKGGEKTFQPIVDRMVKAKNNVIQYVADRGRITQDSADNMIEANKNHLALHTIQEADELTGEKGGSGAILRKRYGSLAKKVDPLTSIYTDIANLIKAGDKNAIRQSLLAETPEYLRKVPPEMQKIDIGGHELMKALDMDTSADASDITLWRPESQRLEENQIEIYTDGKREVYEGAPGVIQALKSLDGNYQAMSAWGKMMQPMAKLLRTGTLMNPAFPLRHYIRSQSAAGIYSQTGMIPYLHPAMSIGDFFTKPETYKNWLYDGGAVKAFNRLDEITTGYGGEEPPWLKKAWNYTKWTAGNLAHINESFIQTTDNLARYTEYKRALDQGYTREQAAFLGRNVTADYQRTGAMRSALKASVPFLNAHVQVTDRAYTEATNPTNVGRPGLDEGRYSAGEEPPTTVTGMDQRLEFAAKTFAGYTVPALLMWAATHGDTRMDERPWWEKMLTFGIPIDHWRKPETPLEYSVTPNDLKMEDKDGNQLVNDGPVLKLPVAGEPQIMFGSCVAAALESYSKKDPEAVKECARQILLSSVIMPIPTAIAAPIEQWAGKNIFTGRNIVSYQKEKELPEDQQDEYTSELAKGISKVIGCVPAIRDIGPGNRTLQSPMVIDNYLHDWFGGGGQYVNEALNKAMQAAGKTDIKVEPEKSWFQEPFVKEFFDKFPNARPQMIENFHEKFKEADEAMASMKDAQKSGNFARMQEIMQKYGATYQELKGINEFLKDKNKNIQIVLRGTNWTPSDKRQILNATYYQMLSTASVGLKMLKTGQPEQGGQ